MNTIKKIWGYKVFRFVCIGVINTATDLSILNFLVFAFGLKVIIANLISASISICLSFFYNHYLVFRQKKQITVSQFIRFFIITGAGILIIQSLVIYGIEHALSVQQIAHHLSVSQSLAKVIRINSAKIIAVLISMVWNFILYTFTVFTEEKEEEGVVPY